MFHLFYRSLLNKTGFQRKKDITIFQVHQLRFIIRELNRQRFRKQLSFIISSPKSSTTCSKYRKPDPSYRFFTVGILVKTGPDN